MDDHFSPLNWSYVNQDEGIEELRHYLLLYTSELETTILCAKEELTKRDVEIVHLKELLNRAIKEKNEAQTQCKQLILEKLTLQQQDQLLHQKLETASAFSPGTYYSSEDESKPGDLSTGSPDPGKVTSNPQSDYDPDDKIQKLIGDKPLPETGKLLLAVKEAGPLLKNLLLAGPLPQWQNPPPELDTIDIPLVSISSSTPSRLIHQESFNSSNVICSSNKRALELGQGPDSSSPSNSNKHQKIVLH